jgi:nicotinamidase-related amidase
MSRTALVVVDAQVNQFDPAHPVAGADALLERLLSLVARAREAGTPVVFIRDNGDPGNPHLPGTPGWHLHPSFDPTIEEPVFDKDDSDAFAGTPLDKDLRGRKVDHVVVVGVRSDHCVRATVLGALDHGYAVTLVSDGHAAFSGGEGDPEEKRRAVNEELADRVTLVDSADVTFDG